MTTIDVSSLKSSCDWIEDTIEKCLNQVVAVTANSGKSGTVSLAQFTAGKMFEAYVFSLFLKRVKALSPNITLSAECLSSSGEFTILGAPGKIDLTRCHVSVTLKGTKKKIARIWNGVEFHGLSYPSGSLPMLSGDIHEGDILVERITTQKLNSYYPSPDNIAAVVECKFVSSMSKAILRNQLGLRREMSYVQAPVNSQLRSLLNVPPTASEQYFKRSLPASAGDKRDVASHTILAHAGSLSGTKPEIVWANPGEKFGLEFWNCW